MEKEINPNEKRAIEFIEKHGKNWSGDYVATLMSLAYKLDSRLTPRAADACTECGGEFLHKEGCSHELDFWA